MDSSGSAIKIANVWKVFGNTSPEALDAIQNMKPWRHIIQLLEYQMFLSTLNMVRYFV
ncbi:hypothetical protein N9X11_04465 [Candidatus Pelagibacter bacterium]|nr:hypothetical protein [Candidatus Pelagibacter bacterium]